MFGGNEMSHEYLTGVNKGAGDIWLVFSKILWISLETCFFLRIIIKCNLG